MSRYTSATDDDRREMLERIGAGSVEELFAGLPEGVRLGRELDLPPGKPEQEVYGYLRDLAAANVSAEDELSFLGAGMYDHYVPALVDSIIQRSEFLTPYTPYQPEISQGGLQVMFEYQTAISELTGLPVSNATVYEGPSAVAAAGYLAFGQTKRTRFVVSRGVHPHSRETLARPPAAAAPTIDEVPLADGVTDVAALREALGDDVCARRPAAPELPRRGRGPRGAGRPRAGGGRDGHRGLRPAHARRPARRPASAASTSPSARARRSATGWTSAARRSASSPPTEKYLRRMPGRIAGETTDVDGRRGFVLTLQTREQHIRREKATPTSAPRRRSTRWRASIYLSWLGRRGIVELAELMLQRTAYARERLAALDGVEPLHDQPVVREFAVRLDAPVDRVVERCAAEGVNPGLPLGPDYDEFADGLLVAITEQRSKADIDRLAKVLGAAVAAERQPAGAAA